MFDHAAASAQVAACIGYAGPVQLTYLPPGGVVVGPFAALVADETPEETGFDRNAGDNQAVVLTISRSLLGDNRPRKGESFIASDGRKFRIAKEPVNPTGPVAVFRCITA
jgi:hypothetical protein